MDYNLFVKRTANLVGNELSDLLDGSARPARTHPFVYHGSEQITCFCHNPERDRLTNIGATQFRWLVTFETSRRTEKMIFLRCLFMGFLYFYALNWSIAQTQREKIAIKNESFEEANADGKPKDWVLVLPTDSVAKLDGEAPAVGERSLLLDARTVSAEGFSNAVSSVDAKPYRGKKVRYRANVRTADLADSSRVQLWMRVDDEATEGEQPAASAFDNMGDRPIRSPKWAPFEIILPIEEKANRIVFGMFLVGKGQAWIDNVSLEIVDSKTQSTSSTASSIPGMNPLVAKAFAVADKAPRQPFFNHWLWLALFAIGLSCYGMWRGSVLAPTVNSGVEASPVGESLLKRFALRFAIAYWILYLIPGPFPALVMPWGIEWLTAGAMKIATVSESLHMNGCQWFAGTCFEISDPLVPKNGSGDTTGAYLEVLLVFILGLFLAAIWSFIDRRRVSPEGSRDLLRSLLRYTLALWMISYGLAKVSLEGNQFPELGAWQLEKKWGDSSPMNVLWAFMGASRPYTIFAGLGEVTAALLLVWRKTAVLGALVALGVMTNVMMMNFCYDVPVKIFSTHLVVMSLMIICVDGGRLFNLFVANRPVPPADLIGIWKNKVAWWIKTTVKLIFVGLFVLLPCALQGTQFFNSVRSRQNAANKAAESTPTNQVPADQIESKYPLLRRGFRWINEIPFNR